MRGDPTLHLIGGPWAQETEVERRMRVLRQRQADLRRARMRRMTTRTLAIVALVVALVVLVILL